MKVGLSGAFVTLGFLIGAQVVAGQKPASTDAPLRFRLALDGGLAYVFSDTGGRVDVGPVAKPGGVTAASFNPHPMFLVVKSGKVQKHPQWPLQRPKTGTEATWALAGYEISPCPDGVCPSASTLAFSPDTGPDPSQPCTPPSRMSSDLSLPAVDNRYYLPDLLALHPSTKLPQDWQRRLDGRVVLREGNLVVVDTFNCVELSGSAVKRRQAVTNGLSGVHYVVPVRTHVDLLFKHRSSGAVTGAIRLVPTGGREIRTHLTMLPRDRKEHALASGDPLPEFQQFYELLPGVPAGSRIAATFKPEGSPGDLSPGQECGSVRFGPEPPVTSEGR
jgi:hypothetical protein